MYPNGVTVEKDVAARCPEGSTRLAPPKTNQLKNAISQAIDTQERRVFPLTDGTQLLPDLGIRGRDKIITTLDGTRERPSIGSEILWQGGPPSECVVQSTVPNGPFHRAGVLPGDVCERWNETPLTGSSALVGCLDNAYPGETVNFHVRRNGQPIGPVPVVLGVNRNLGAPPAPLSPVYPVVYPDPAPPEEEAPALRPWFGAQIKFVDEVETGRRNNLVQIYEVEHGSPAYRAGLLPDDILRTWDGTPIEGEHGWKDLFRGVAIGDQVQLGIIRRHQRLDVPLTIEGTDRQKRPKQRVTTSTVASTTAYG